MADPVSLPFEIRGGSPTVLEATMPDGSKKTLRIAVSVMEVLIHPDIPNPNDPNSPVFQIRASMAVDSRE